MCEEQKSLRKALTPIQVTEQQQARVNNDQYTIRRMDETQYHIETAKISENTLSNIPRVNVRNAIIDNLGRDRYAAFDELMIKKEGEEENKDIALHHSLGSKLSLEGEDVLEFNMAGSGFMNYSLPHKEMKGYGTSDDYKDKKSVSWYNINRFLTWTGLVKTKSQIEDYNALHSGHNKKIEDIYGRKVESLKGQKMNHIRKKESVNDKNARKTRFYMRGPNVVNTGKYSEDRLEEYILELGKETLKNKFDLWDFLDDEDLAKEKPVNIIIQGHSRGAVASGLGAMRLKRWVYDNYPRLLNKVKFQLIQYDPVAGGYENFGFNSKIDHAPESEKDATKDKRYMSLGDEADTTVVYSMHTQYPALFTPQYVKNAKRIILTAAGHGANLDKTDETQDKTTRVTYLAEKNGKIEAFRSTGLGELDEGIYIADDQNNLIKIRNMEEYDALAKTLLAGVSMQDSRHETVRKAVETWFSKEKKSVGDIEKKKSDKAEAKEAEEKFRNELSSLTTPAALKKIQEEKDKLEKMPQDTPANSAKYLKKKEKYLKAKKAGLINYVNSLYKQKGSYINKTRRDYLRELINLSYHLEKDTGGFHSESRTKKIADSKEKLRKFVGVDDLDRFLPPYLKRELYFGSEEKVRAFFGMPASVHIEEKEEKPVKIVEEKAEEEKPVENVEEKAEEKVEEKKIGEEKPAETVEEKKVKELPFTYHDVQTDIPGMDQAYEEQQANNCFACTGSALLNHFIARKKGEGNVTRRFTQKDFRNFRPEVRKFDETNQAGIEEQAYYSAIKEINRYAGEGKTATGAIFEMGDFMLDKLSENKIENVMLNRFMLNVPDFAKENIEKKSADVRMGNYKAAFADKIAQIISEGGAAGVLISSGKDHHYVTVTGIKGDELTVYDSIYYKGPVTRKLDYFIKTNRQLEISWLSDVKPPEELEKEYPNLEYKEGKAPTLKQESINEYLTSISHTKGVTVLKEMDDNEEGLNMAQMSYIPVKDLAIEKKQLKDAVDDAADWEQEELIKEQEAKEKAEEEAKQKEAEEALKQKEPELKEPEQKASEQKEAEKAVQEEIKEEQKVEQKEELKEEAKQKEAEKNENEQFESSVKDVFRDIFKGRGSFPDILKKLNYDFKSEKNEEVSYNRIHAAAERVSALIARSGEEKNAPGPEELMETMTVLSESANAYYDLHRGHQYTSRGQNRRESCDSIRQLVNEFYDRLDMKTGGKGFGNVTEAAFPEETTSKEKKKAGEKLKELYEHYEKWKKHFAAREGCDRITVRDKAKLFASYERYIEIYKASHPVRKRSKEMDEIIRTAAYYKLQNAVVSRFEDQKTGFNDPLAKLAHSHADAMDNRQKPERELKKDTDKGLSTDQLKAVDAIDQWFVRNYNNTGAVGWAVGARNHHGEAVTALLNKTKRERLFIYYLIETRKRKNPDIMDVYLSQMQDYVPDLEKLKSQMLHTRFKVLSHLSGQYVAMNKLSEATQINREYKDLIVDCAEPVSLNETDKAEKLQELKKDKVAYRTYALGEVFRSTKTYRDKASEYLKKGKKDAKTEAELNALKEKAASDLKELIAADTAVGEAEGYAKIDEKDLKLKTDASSRPDTNPAELSQNTAYYKKYGAMAAENTGSVVKGVSKGISYIPVPGSGGWKLKDSTLAATDFFAGTVSASGVNAVGSLLTAIYGIYNLSKGASSLHAGDIGANIVKIANSVTQTTTNVWKGVEATQQYISSADKVMQGAVSFSPALKVMGAVTSGISTGLESYNAVSGLLDCRNHSKAVAYLKQRAAEKGDKNAGQEKFEKNMLKVSGKLSSRKAGMGGFNAVASGMTVAGLFVPFFGTVITLTGVGLTMLAGAVNIFGIDMKNIRRTMFDSYFGFDEFMDKAQAEMKRRGEKIYDMKEFKRRMRRMLAAAAGFSDVETACDHIGKKYADYVCSRLFGEDGERTTDENEKKGYIQLIKSFGLPYSEQKKLPGAAALARKMNGR